MRADLGAIYDDTITVINKLDAKDSALRQDVYYATVIHHCMWASKTIRQVGSNGDVNIGVVHQVQIPESENYQPYREWKASRDTRADAFTLRNGDYIIRGVYDGEVTASTLRSIVKDYEPDAFQIQTFRDATKGDGFEHSTNGIMRFTEVYYCEG